MLEIPAPNDNRQKSTTKLPAISGLWLYAYALKTRSKFSCLLSASSSGLRAVLFLHDIEPYAGSPKVRTCTEEAKCLQRSAASGACDFDLLA